MSFKSKLSASAIALSASVSALFPAYAHDGDGGHVNYATDHAPIGVMADHRHKKGEWMTSYRFMYMDMEGNRDGTDSISNDEIVTTIPNRFAGMPMMPPTLRVVPDDMTMKMHMLGGMYGLSDRVTLMAMAMYTTNDMNHTTYMGGMGKNVLGDFNVETSGFGDTTIGAIIGLDDGKIPHQQFNLGISLSLPTGSIEETGQILTPMNQTPTPRSPYAMQLGSGSFDLKPSLTARTLKGKWSFGGQASAVIRLNENDENYTLGDKFEATAWAAYEFVPSFSVSGRLRGETLGAIDGQDTNIMAPVQTADPANYGGEKVEALIGFNYVGQKGFLKGQRVAVEAGMPFYQDLNGPQMETDFTLNIGWQKAF